MRPSERSPGEPDRGTVTGLLGDPDGASTFQVMTYAYDDRDLSCKDAAFTSGMDGNVYRPTTCRVLTDDAGEPIGRLTTEVPATGDGTTIRQVTVRQGKGFVYLLSTNTDYPKMDTTTPSSIDRPPLTLAELRDIALSPAWTTWTPPAGG